MLELSSNNVGERTVREEIAILAGPRHFGSNRESWLAGAYRRLQECGSDITFRMLKSFFNNEIRDPEKHWAAREIRRTASIVQAQREAQALAKHFNTILQNINVRSPHYDQPRVDAVRRAIRHLVGEDNA